ncbi:hypothetical protein pb186bvf_011645 [Paramecium bursaria]
MLHKDSQLINSIDYLYTFCNGYMENLIIESEQDYKNRKFFVLKFDIERKVQNGNCK